MSAAELLLNMENELKVSLRNVETYLLDITQPATNRAELRGKQWAYSNFIGMIKLVRCQLDRMGAPSNIEGAIAHIEAAERLLAEVTVKGYKSEYCKGVVGDSLTASRRALIGLWNVVSEESISGA